MGKPRKKTPPDIRFRRKIEPAPPNEHGCRWFWSGAVGSNGYGNFWTGERYVSAHRFAFELANGPIENGGKRGPVVMHSCDTPLCCDEEHLVLGTHGSNHEDCRRKGRGVQYLRAVSPEEESEIASRWRAGETQTALGQEFGINQTTVSRIVRRAA